MQSCPCQNGQMDVVQSVASTRTPGVICLKIGKLLHVWCWFFSWLIFVVFGQCIWPFCSHKAILLHSWGTYLTLTGCIVHGVGIYLYLTDEGMPGGSNWTIECVTQLKILSSKRGPNNKKSWYLNTAKVMKSIDRAWAKMRSLNRELPKELLG